MDTGLLDVLHDAADDDFLAVADRIDVDLDREVEESIEQDRAVVRDADGAIDVVPQLVFAVHDLHRAAAEHVGRPHDQRVADLLGHRDGFLDVARRAIRRLLELQPIDELLKALAVLGEVDRVRRRADDRHAGFLQRARELQRRLAAVLHDDALRLFLVHDLEDVLERHGLEVQPVGAVVVGRHGLRVAVDHDGLVAGFLERERRVHAAVVELDSLADAVRAAAQDHDLLPIGRIRLAEFLVRGIEVGRVARELGRTAVDSLEYRPDVLFVTRRSDDLFLDADQVCDAPVAEAAALELAQLLAASRPRGPPSSPASRCR